MLEKKKEEDIIQRPLEESGDNREKELPEMEYKKEQKRIKNRIAIGVLSILAVEAVTACFFTGTIAKNHIHKRVIREYQYQSDGKISLNAGTYTGDMDFGIFEGDGEFAFDTGSVYKGEWKNDNIEGLGVFETSSEGSYEGEFSKGAKSGEGVFSWNNGDTYEGEWKNDKMQGKGTYTTKKDVVYKGIFDDNEFKEGTCEFENDTGSYTVTFQKKKIATVKIHYTDGTDYSGECTKNGLNGSGTMKFGNDESYTGEFEKNKRSGKGVYTWKSGATYDGDWLNDDMNGTGTYTYSKDNYATGTFEKNIFIRGTYHMLNDFGEYTFKIEQGEPVSVEMKLTNGTTYSGEMSNGKLNGNAQIKYSNGDQYSGNVTDNQKSGQGTYTWTSGASYDGNWSNDKMNGSGSYTYGNGENGYMLTGNFKDGRPEGECVYYVSSSESYKTDWSNGTCVKVYE